MGFAELAQEDSVLRRGCAQHPQHQHVHVVTDCELDLRYLALDGETSDQGPQWPQQAGDSGRHDLARVHVGHERTALLMKTDEHTTLLRHIAHGETRPLAVAPERPVDGRQHRLGAHAPDVPQIVFQLALLDRDLSEGIQMLQAAAPAHTEMAAAWRHPL